MFNPVAPYRYLLPLMGAEGLTQFAQPLVSAVTVPPLVSDWCVGVCKNVECVASSHASYTSSMSQPRTVRWTV